MNQLYDIVIDPEFRSLIPPLTEQEMAGLEENLLRDGCLEPLIVWAEQQILLDGHNRKQICDCYGIDYGVRELSFPMREAAADWIDANQLGRRNLTPEQMSLLRGRRYNRLKNARGGTGANRHTEQMDQSDPSAPTAVKLAKEHGVSAPTIKRDGQYTEAVDTLGVQQEAAAGRGVPGGCPGEQHHGSTLVPSAAGHRLGRLLSGRSGQVLASAKGLRPPPEINLLRHFEDKPEI